MCLYVYAYIIWLMGECGALVYICLCIYIANLPCYYGIKFCIEIQHVINGGIQVSRDRIPKPFWWALFSRLLGGKKPRKENQNLYVKPIETFCSLLENNLLEHEHPFDEDDNEDFTEANNYLNICNILCTTLLWSSY